ncbi:hypothetical protein GCM10009107_56570 [Ideonella azotifigens]|uniref:Uncharacterized protein n=1 Tax=Ideonella azotifigens TaxID=513160 RepID=A0ABN1KI30_9BURK
MQDLPISIANVAAEVPQKGLVAIGTADMEKGLIPRDTDHPAITLAEERMHHACLAIKADRVIGECKKILEKD